jgi:hypothetical protein
MTNSYCDIIDRAAMTVNKIKPPISGGSRLGKLSSPLLLPQTHRRRDYARRSFQYLFSDNQAVGVGEGQKQGQDNDNQSYQKQGSEGFLFF